MGPNSTRIKELKKALQLKLEELAIARCFSLAFSGGLDSRFLAFFAKSIDMKPTLLHICGPHIPAEETNHAVQWAKDNDLDLRVFPVNPFDEPRLITNPKNRCYLCKTRLFSFLKMQTLLPLADGTNASDLREFRPGMRALEEIGVHSPLLEAGFSKEDIRMLGKEMGMDFTEQASTPCLFTRFPYGFRQTEKLLNAVAVSEEKIGIYLQQAFGRPFPLRVRVLADDLVQAHLLRRDFPELSEHHKETILTILRQEFSACTTPSIHFFENLSGFFDQHPEFSVVLDPPKE